MGGKLGRVVVSVDFLLSFSAPIVTECVKMNWQKPTVVEHTQQETINCVKFLLNSSEQREEIHWQTIGVFFLSFFRYVYLWA